jgi:hypothetical protein
LLVRLGEGERDPAAPNDPNKRFVDKDPATGLCAQLDPDTMRCRVWADAPRHCREFDCNADWRLQSVLRHGFVSIVNFPRVHRELPLLQVPYCDEPDPR